MAFDAPAPPQQHVVDASDSQHLPVQQGDFAEALHMPVGQQQTTAGVAAINIEAEVAQTSAFTAICRNPRIIPILG
jgi:hypothetical protein